MGAIEEGGRVVKAVIESMHTQPLALALVVVNVVYLVGGFVWLREERARTADVIRELIQHCVISKEDR